MRERRVSVPASRFAALVRFASMVGCICGDPANREHGGKCIGCWALAKRIENLRQLAPGSPTLTRYLAESESEQRFRAESLPAAERRLADARKEDEQKP
jgi:hypothetical protein